ncbi:uncharacterized protein LOC131669497 [Phymastichus coffea]|uniref:uncharacterized protein LOC131669497 n=1 Tax=Phymastichus coffea TaxID=108790 RepID=UPI00273CA2B3|nr:uncharacterized protein LOC131669497 [Phymastichus coffea]
MQSRGSGAAGPNRAARSIVITRYSSALAWPGTKLRAGSAGTGPRRARRAAARAQDKGPQARAARSRRSAERRAAGGRRPAGGGRAAGKGARVAAAGGGGRRRAGAERLSRRATLPENVALPRCRRGLPAATTVLVPAPAERPRADRRADYYARGCRRGPESARESDPAMRLSPIILSAAVCASSGQQLHQQPQQAPRPRCAEQAPGQRQLRAELSTEYFLQVSPADRRRSQVASVVSVPAAGDASAPRAAAPAPRPQPLLRPQPWALPLLALSAAAMLLMAAFEVFVLLKARAAAPSRRHLFLGQALLLGLFLLAGLSAAASLSANPVSCAAFRLVGLPAALVFAALLVKCVFLLSLNSGVYLPAPYQALVLGFAVLVQVAIVGQWLYGELGSATTAAAAAPGVRASGACHTPLGQSLAALGYPALLLLAAAGLAVRARGVRDNFREAWFIGLAVGLALPVWLGGALGALLAPEAAREAWLGFGLLSSAILVFLAMFLPKGRQLAALGREAAPAGGAHLPLALAGGPARPRPRPPRRPTARDDCEDRPSDYSPSFFHFKPAPAESTLKRKPAPAQHYHSADRVALVSSCSACRHRPASPVYSDATSASNFDQMPYIHGPMETFVLPPGMYLRPEDTGNLYTTLSANPNVFFQRAHPGMMY